MVVNVERLAFSVTEAAESAGCGPYEIISLAIEKGVQIFTYLPSDSMAVRVDRMFVQGEPVYWPITPSLLRWQWMPSFPCIIGFLLDDIDCRHIVQQRKASRTFFDWGVVIAGKEAPVKVLAADKAAILICSPRPSTDPDAYSGEGIADDLKLPEPILPEIDEALPESQRPFSYLPQYCFGAYPAGLEVKPDYEQLRLPRPKPLTLVPEHLFLLKEGMEQLGLLTVSSNDVRAGLALGGGAEGGAGLRFEEGLTGGEAVAVPTTIADAPGGHTGLPRNVQFSGIEVQDYWPYWLKGFIKVASKEWEKWRKDDGVTQTSEDRDSFELALLRLNNDHKGRILEVAEARSCVTMLSPLWARHWGGKEDRPNSPATPVTEELLEMIATAEAIKEFNENSCKKLLRKDIKAWLERALYHSFSQNQLKIAVDLLFDIPKKSGKNKTKKAIKKQPLK